MAKNNNIVGQGLAPADWCGILPMAKRANTVRPYDWIFYQWLKICTPTQAFSFRKAAHFPRRGTAPAVDEVLNYTNDKKQQHYLSVGVKRPFTESTPLFVKNDQK